MKTFIESERFCEASFLSGGHFWHAFTSGKDTPLLFVTEDDFRSAACWDSANMKSMLCFHWPQGQGSDSIGRKAGKITIIGD